MLVLIGLWLIALATGALLVFNKRSFPSARASIRQSRWRRLLLVAIAMTAGSVLAFLTVRGTDFSTGDLLIQVSGALVGAALAMSLVKLLVERYH